MLDGFSYTGVLPPPQARSKLYLFTPVFFWINKLYGNVDGAFTQNDIINF